MLPSVEDPILSVILQTTTKNCKARYQQKKLTKAITLQIGFTITNTTMLPAGTLSFQGSQPIRSGKDIPITIDTIKCFWSK